MCNTQPLSVALKYKKKAAAAAAKLELWETFQMNSTELRGDESTENLNELWAAIFFFSLD